MICALRSSSALHVGGRHRQQLDLAERLDAGRADAAVEHRQLADELAGPEGGQRDRAAVGVLARHPDLAGADHVTGVAAIAFVEDPGALRERARNGDLGDPLELSGLEPGEQRNARKKLCSAGLFLAHGRDYR